MPTVKTIAFKAGRGLLAFLFMRWAHIPFFGFLLVFVWAWWLAIALSW
jgi:hypothetical protein